MLEERSGLAQRLAPYLDTGERLPTVRQLAVDLGVHPTSVARAYQELELLGVLVVRPGGTFVALSSPDTSTLEREAQLERLCRDFLSQADAFGFTSHELIDTLRDLSADAPDRGTRGTE